MENFIDEVVNYILANRNNAITVQQLADHFNYSYAHFSREFKREFGIGASEFMSSLRFESIRNNIVNTNDSISHEYISAGYASFGTFSSQFKRYTGQSPQSYRNSLRFYNHFINNLFINSPIYSHPPSKDNNPKLEVTLKLPSNLNNFIIFIGLFEKPIANHKPIQGVALINQTQCSFQNPPPGKYYLLTFAYDISPNFFEAFTLKKSLRASIKTPFIFPLSRPTTVELPLRHPLPSDAPILYNFPKLLFDTLKKNKD